MNKLTPEQRGYHAAAIDGEGCISISKGRKENYYHLSIDICNTNLLFLLYLKQTSGIGIIHNSHIETKTSKKRYTWMLHKHEIREYLEAIINSLIIKRQQAEIMLEFLPLVKIRYSRHNPPSVENLAMRDILWEEIKILNRKGPPSDPTIMEIQGKIYSPKVAE